VVKGKKGGNEGEEELEGDGRRMVLGSEEL
jgi:hypothetical protein